MSSYSFYKTYCRLGRYGWELAVIAPCCSRISCDVGVDLAIGFVSYPESLVVAGDRVVVEFPAKQVSIGDRSLFGYL
jgi:hypothetical protein